VPLVPVTVTVNVPLLVVEGTLIVSVDVPDAVTDGGFSVVVSPPPETVSESETVPAKPFKVAIFIVEVPCDPLRMLRLVGDAEIEKFGLVTVTVNVAVLLKPLVSVPVTVTGYVPLDVLDGTVIVSAELGLLDGRVIDVGLNEALQPLGTGALRMLNVPAYPLSDVAVTVEVPAEPA